MDFEIKYRSGSETKTVLISAPNQTAAGKAFTSSHPGISANDIVSVNDLGSINRKGYGAARFVGSTISFVGWIVLLLGVLGILFGLIASMGANSFAIQLQMNPLVFKVVGGLVIASSLLYAVFGLVCVALGQYFRAAVDTANYNAEMLALMRSRTR